MINLLTNTKIEQFLLQCTSKTKLVMGYHQGSNEATVDVDVIVSKGPEANGRQRKIAVQKMQRDGGGRMGDNEQFRVLVTGSI